MVYIILHDENGERFEEMYSKARANASWVNLDCNFIKSKITSYVDEVKIHEKNLYLKNFRFRGKESDPEKDIKTIIDESKKEFEKACNIFIQISNDGITGKQLSILTKKYCSDKDEKKSNICFYNFGKTYILNKTFFDSGYSVLGNNIAHEAINAFKSDDGKRYFYLCKDGKLTDFIYKDEGKMPRNFIDISKTELINFSKKSEGDKTEYVILQKVTGIETLDFAFADRQSKIADYGNIKYNNTSIAKIFECNTSLREGKGKTDTETYPLITFGLTSEGKVKKPANPLGFPGDRKGFDNLASSSCRQFVMEGTELFEAIKNLIKAQNEWTDDNASTVGDYLNSRFNEDYEERFLLKIIGKERKETYYSKLLTFVFANSPEIAEEFLKKIYGKNVNVKTLTGVYNEKYNIDVCFTYLDSNGKEHLVVIENKIDASFTEKGKKTLKDFFTNKADEKYVKEVNEKFAEYKDSKIKANQLTKYYLISQVLAKESNIEKDNINYIVLAPEYKTGFLDKEKNDYYYGEKYKVVSYKALKEAIDTIINDNQCEYNKLDDDIKDITIQFNRSIWPYISDSCSYYQRVMCNRFARATKKIKNG